MKNDKELERLRQRVKRGNELVSEARLSAVETIIGIDDMLSWIIADYFTKDESKRGLLYEILTLLTTSEKIDVFSNLETSSGVRFRRRYGRIIRRARLLNSYRNTMVHGFPSVFYDTNLWRGHGRLLPFPLNENVVRKMARVGKTTFDALSKVLEQIMKKPRSYKESKGDL